MAAISDIVNKIFLSFESFFQKATALDIFETLIFNYKVKMGSVDKCPSQILTILVQLENELQAILKECVYVADDQWKTYSIANTECVQAEQIFNVNVDGTVLTAQQATQEEIADKHSESGIQIHIGDINAEKDHEQSFQLVKNAESDPVIDPSVDDNILAISSARADISEQVVIPTSGIDSQIFKCQVCLRKFRTAVKLMKHLCKKLTFSKNLITLNTDETYKEDETLLSVTNDKLPDIEDHQVEIPTPSSDDSDLPVYTCSVCCISFMEKEPWDEHICKDKDGTSNGKRSLIASRLLLSERRFVCGFCSETYRSLGRIVYHLVRCAAGPYSCEICKNSFSTRSELNYHKKKQHKGVESFFCNECGLGFKLRTSLQKHLINRHESLKGEFPCDLPGCQQVFPKKIFLTHHKINEHRLERKYLCQVCGNKFYNRCSLTSHLETHSNKKQFSCLFCSKIVKTKEKLTLHVRTHTGERPYSCTTCGKAFVAKSKLEEHSRRHRGEKRYKCKTCAKMYANGFDLRQHLKKCQSKPPCLLDKRKELNANTVIKITTTGKTTLNDATNMGESTVESEDLISQSSVSAQGQQNVEVVPVDNTVTGNFNDDSSNENSATESTANRSNVIAVCTSNCTTSTNSGAALSTTSTTASSGLVVQVDSEGCVIPVQTTAVHVLDYVPYYQPEPLHIVVPQSQTQLVLSGYDSVQY